MKLLVLLSLLIAFSCDSQGASEKPPATEPAPNEPTPPDQIAPPDPIELPRLRETHEGSFATSLACSVCHSNSPDARAMRGPDGEPIAPFDLWQASMKANSTRDPLFRAVLAAERAATPTRAEEIEQKCLTCHAPMATDHLRQRGEPIRLETLYEDSRVSQLAIDGVSCTTCHQLDPATTGTPETFSGQFRFSPEKVAYGPHEGPFERPMVNRSGFRPVASDHITEARLCASCHTLFTDAHLPDGTLLDAQLPEQSPYLEWQNSAFNDEIDTPGPDAASCQDCHMPTRIGDQAVRTAIARRPDGSDFPPIGPRQPYGQHLFVGGNTLIPAILRDHADDLNPLAPPEAFDAIIALATEQLQERTATVSLSDLTSTEDHLAFTVTVSNLTGHKIPTAYPSRRIWLRLTVRDATSAVVFQSGHFDTAGRLLDPQGSPLPSEFFGGPIHPHRAEITSPDHVQIYESIMGDADGRPTMRLMHGATYLKDNRILPRGWHPDHPQAAHTTPQGVDDDSFRDGSDTITVRIPLTGPSPHTVEAALFYQTLSPRYADALFQWDLPEVNIFRHYYENADRTPVPVASTTATTP